MCNCTSLVYIYVYTSWRSWCFMGTIVQVTMERYQGLTSPQPPPPAIARWYQGFVPGT